MSSTRPLWTPDAERIGKAPLTAFLRLAGKAAGRSFAGYADLHRWSIEDRAGFWNLVWEFCEVAARRAGACWPMATACPAPPSSPTRG